MRYALLQHTAGLEARHMHPMSEAVPPTERKVSLALLCEDTLRFSKSLFATSSLYKTVLAAVLYLTDLVLTDNHLVKRIREVLHPKQYHTATK